MYNAKTTFLTDFNHYNLKTILSNTEVFIFEIKESSKEHIKELLNLGYKRYLEEKDPFIKTFVYDTPNKFYEFQVQTIKIDNRNNKYVGIGYNPTVSYTGEKLHDDDAVDFFEIIDKSIKILKE